MAQIVWNWGRGLVTADCDELFGTVRPNEPTPLKLRLEIDVDDTPILRVSLINHPPNELPRFRETKIDLSRCESVYIDSGDLYDEYQRLPDTVKAYWIEKLDATLPEPVWTSLKGQNTKKRTWYKRRDALFHYIDLRVSTLHELIWEGEDYDSLPSQAREIIDALEEWNDIDCFIVFGVHNGELEGFPRFVKICKEIRERRSTLRIAKLKEAEEKRDESQLKQLECIQAVRRIVIPRGMDAIEVFNDATDKGLKLMQEATEHMNEAKKWQEEVDKYSE